jgi:hypothetical protein
MLAQSLTHSLQMYARGPAISRVTSSAPFPQKEQESWVMVARS